MRQHRSNINRKKVKAFVSPYVLKYVLLVLKIPVSTFSVQVLMAWIKFFLPDEPPKVLNIFVIAIR